VTTQTNKYEVKDVTDIYLPYLNNAADANGDGEVNIADINTIIDVILSGGLLPAADVNGDGEVNIADINFVIDFILG